MRHPSIVTPENCGLLVIDVQEKLMPAIHEPDDIVANVVRLVLAFEMFKRPVLITEQYPKGLGGTVNIIRMQLPDVQAIEKMTFSCMETETFRATVREMGLKTIVACGVESHVCVSQTVLDLLADGMKVHVVADAIGSRHTGDHEVALQRMYQAGAVPATTESVLFDLCHQAGTPDFKNVQRMIRAKLKQPSHREGFVPSAPSEMRDVEAETTFEPEPAIAVRPDQEIVVLEQGSESEVSQTVTVEDSDVNELSFEQAGANEPETVDPLKEIDTTELGEAADISGISLDEDVDVEQLLKAVGAEAEQLEMDEWKIANMDDLPADIEEIIGGPSPDKA